MGGYVDQVEPCSKNKWLQYNTISVNINSHQNSKTTPKIQQDNKINFTQRFIQFTVMTYLVLKAILKAISEKNFPVKFIKSLLLGGC